MTARGLRAEGLTLGYDDRDVVHALDLTVPDGRVSAIVGANGCGKSTLLRGLARLMTPRRGAVLIDGRPLRELSTKAIARRLAILPQSPLAPEGLTVEDLVARGRYPHQSLLRQWSPDDEQAVESALAATGTTDLRGRRIDELSGGQRQRAWIAMTLAQDTEILLLDEPTTFLDLAHQIEVLDLLAGLAADHGRTVVMVLHDLNQACRYADHLVAMRDGRVHASGPPAGVVDAALVEQVFGLPVRVVDDPVTGTPLCVPAGGRRGSLPLSLTGGLMNRLAVLLVLLILSVSLAACGSSEDDGGGSGTGGGSPAGADAFPVTIEHKFGRTEIKAEPKRVVNVGYTEQDTLLALDASIVATRDFLGGYDYKKRPWAQEALGGKDLPTVGGEQINFESVAAQRPDLIIAINTGMNESDYKRLSKIAPTVAQAGDYVDFGMPWQEQTTLIGRAVGREDQARNLVRDVEAKFEQARRDHPEFEGMPAILAYGGPEGYGAYTTQDTRSRFFTDLGFELPKEIDKLAGKAFFTDLSQERFRLIDRDLVVMYGPQKEIEQNKVFSRLDAVKEGRVVYMDYGDQFAGALGFASVLSLPWLLDNEVDTLAAAADGEAATKVEQPK